MNLETEFDKLDKATDKLGLKPTEKRMIKLYKDSLDDMYAELGAIYRKYENADNLLTYADLQRVNKYNSMINDINNKVYSLTKFKMDYITKAMQATYEHEHKGTFTIINDAIAGNIPAGYELLYAFPDAKELNAIINLQVGGMTLEDRLTSHGRALGLALQQDITQGLILGKSYAELSKLVQARMGSDLSKAQTLVRTELNRVKNAGRLDSLKMLEDKGVTMEKEWQSLHDKWVRHSHTMLDGKKVPVTGSFKINYKGFVYEAPAPHQFGAAALDVNCRCRIVPALPDEIILDFDKMDKSK